MGKTSSTGEFAISKSRNSFGRRRFGSEKLAVKVIDKERITTIKGLERAVNEIRILREASHPNILVLFDVIQTKKNLYLVVERGHRDMYDFLEEMQSKATHVDEKIMKSLMKQLICGLEYLHDMNVCHRDVKPENLLIIEGGNQNLKLKLLDFGMCTVKGVEYGFMALKLRRESSGFIADMLRVRFRVSNWSLAVRRPLDARIQYKYF